MATGNLSRINTNISALNALNALNSVNSRLNVHSLRLATGKQINSAADDAAGLTIATKLHVRAQGLGVAIDNIGSAKNLMTVAEGHLTNISDILSQMKAKVQQAANDTLGVDERAAILQELQKFNSQIDAEVGQALWSDTNILQASTNGLDFQIGAGTSAICDEVNFNVAGEIWSGGGTTFNSAGLQVAATGVVTSSFTSAVAATSGLTAAIGTSSVLNTSADTLAAGNYTVEIGTTGHGSAAGVTVSIKVKDADGNYINIDEDGNAAAGDAGEELTYTLATGSTNAAILDLGNGVTIDLAAIAAAATASNATTSASYTLSVTTSGNAVSNQDAAQNFMTKLDDAIGNVSSALTYIGSMINRLSFQEDSLSVAKINTEAAGSRLVDADMAKEQLEATKLQILQQTATAMLAQANVAPQAVLGLFQ